MLGFLSFITVSFVIFLLSWAVTCLLFGGFVMISWNLVATQVIHHSDWQIHYMSAVAGTFAFLLIRSLFLNGNKK